MAETYGFAHIWIWILIRDGHWDSVYGGNIWICAYLDLDSDACAWIFPI